MKNTKAKLISSVTVLLICFAMLIGSTFAWFTDSASTGVNKIQAGNLDVELYHNNDGLVTETLTNKVDEYTKLFDVNLWEPGMAVYENLLIKNAGNLAFKYQLGISQLLENKNFNYLVEAGSPAENHTGKTLMDVLYVYECDENLDANVARNLTANDGILLKTYLNAGLMKTGQLKAGESKKLSLVIYWPESDIDNNYNVNNGRSTTPLLDENDNVISGTQDKLTINFPITVYATQYTYENDSFDNQYDKNAGIDAVWGGITTTDTSINVDTSSPVNTLTINEGNETLVEVTVPTSELAPETTKLNLTVTRAETEIANPVVTVTAGNNSQTFDVELVDQNGNKVTTSNDPMKVTLNIGIVDLQEFYHKGTLLTSVDSEDEVNSVGKYYYDTATGIVTYMTNSFSPFTAVYKLDGGLGTETSPYLITNKFTWKSFADSCEDRDSLNMTDGKYFQVTDDIDVSDYEVLYPNNPNACVYYFGGHIDFTNKYVYGFNSVNGNAGYLFAQLKGDDVVVENVNLQTTTIQNGGTVVAFALTGDSLGNITINNSNVYGSASGLNTNNNGLFAEYLGYTDEFGYGGDYTYTISNCNNYANITGSKLTAAFVGAGGLGNNGVIKFSNCNNYGNIVSSGDSASMLISNCTYFNWQGNTDILIDNCNNYGNIFGTNAQYSTLLMNPNTGDSVFYTKYASINGSEKLGQIGWVNGQTKINHLISSCISGSNPVKIESGTLETSDNKFLLSTVDGAIKYELAFSFSSANRNGGGAGYTLYFEDALPENIMVGNWITKSEAENSGIQIIEHNEYDCTYYTCGDSYVYYEDNAAFLHNNRDVFVSFIAYDENSTPISISTFTYNQ